MIGSIIFWAASAVAAFVAVVIAVWIINLRRVVPTNQVHIVQRSGGTVSYGKDTGHGNTYYHWPTWIPRLGIQVINLPVSNFPIRLDAYEIYDKDRLPAQLDIEAFFRIENPNQAAQRVSTFKELVTQLRSILEGASRSMLASKDIHTIMTGRSEFGEAFTKEVDEQLKEWGVTTVKSVELMDVRDSQGSKVIENIMARKKSEIERDSRVTVAENRRKAEEAEITAQREVAVANEQAQQQVGIASATKTMEVGVANEQTDQKIKEQKRITTEKDMEVRRVELVKQAEITKDVEVVRAQEQRAVDVERAEGEKQKTVLIAQGTLESERMVADAVLLRGTAEAESLKLKELAPVQAQITLAKEIGENQSYQSYLIQIRQIEASEEVGKEQAAALQKSDVKIIANAGTPADGLKGVGELFSSSGGLKLGAALEGLMNTDTGKAVVSTLLKG